MRFTLLVQALFVLSHVRSSWTLFVDNIEDCPIPTRQERATNVDNLRISDIEVIAALGDSITAGLLGRNIDTDYITLDQLKEHRGQSFIIGGDDDAHSLATYIKHYNKNLYGASRGVKNARLCPDTIFCLDAQHTPEIDVLNAAQSGATSRELDEQIDYLLPYIDNNSEHANKWKLINVFIGFNDVSVSCLPGRNATEYYNNLYKSVGRLLQNVDYAFVNIVGLMHYNDLVYLTLKEPHYRKKFQHSNLNLLDFECFCCKAPEGNLSTLGEHVERYNQMLQLVATELTSTILEDIFDPLFGKRPKNVAVVYQPMSPLIPTVPHSALSNIDGYHPNTKGYKFLSTKLWNQMFLPKALKEDTFPFNETLPIFCPSELDRLETYRKLF